MDPSTLDLIKIWGPLALGWVVAFYLLRFIMERYDKDIDAKIKLALALDALAAAIKENRENRT